MCVMYDDLGAFGRRAGKSITVGEGGWRRLEVLGCVLYDMLMHGMVEGWRGRVWVIRLCARVAGQLQVSSGVVGCPWWTE